MLPPIPPPPPPPAAKINPPSAVLYVRTCPFVDPSPGILNVSMSPLPSVIVLLPPPIAPLPITISFSALFASGLVVSPI